MGYILSRSSGDEEDMNRYWESRNQSLPRMDVVSCAARRDVRNDDDDYIMSRELCSFVAAI